MYLLAIDTASSAAGAAVASENGIIAVIGLNVGKTHSQRFLPSVAALLENAEIALSELSAIAVTVGPGSFTGLRIGIATAKAWGQALNLPIVPLTTLEALAFGACDEGLVCPILDARKNEVYSALFRKNRVKNTLEEVFPAAAVAPAELAEKLCALGEPIIFAGDALPLYTVLLREGLGENFVPAAEDRRVFMASAAALLGRERLLAGQVTTAHDLQPFYLRRSEAEVKKAQKQEDKQA